MKDFSIFRETPKKTSHFVTCDGQDGVGEWDTRSPSTLLPHWHDWWTGRTLTKDFSIKAFSSHEVVIILQWTFMAHYAKGVYLATELPLKHSRVVASATLVSIFVRLLFLDWRKKIFYLKF
ncbi:hypothetical protein NPIL_72081 [Nephila pilipes]|uniref:Uncharacterized protein n=1 Tax=Nephila pilipes TaxID=299642 RepID=A0A8X6NHB6_NEPPI|nr:hypothetical protein NPIL_72081 [Nephila pilipes]